MNLHTYTGSLFMIGQLLQDVLTMGGAYAHLGEAG